MTFRFQLGFRWLLVTFQLLLWCHFQQILTCTDWSYVGMALQLLYLRLLRVCISFRCIIDFKWLQFTRYVTKHLLCYNESEMGGVSYFWLRLHSYSDKLNSDFSPTPKIFLISCSDFTSTLKFSKFGKTIVTSKSHFTLASFLVSIV